MADPLVTTVEFQEGLGKNFDVLDDGGSNTAYGRNFFKSYFTVSSSVWVVDAGCYREVHYGYGADIC